MYIVHVSKNTDTEGNDMNELVYILEAAKEHNSWKMYWWKRYQTTKDESDYQMFRQEHGYVQGLLNAYEIVGGSVVKPYDIENELEKIA